MSMLSWSECGDVDLLEPALSPLGRVAPEEALGAALMIQDGQHQSYDSLGWIAAFDAVRAALVEQGIRSGTQVYHDHPLHQRAWRARQIADQALLLAAEEAHPCGMRAGPRAYTSAARARRRERALEIVDAATR